MKISYNWLKEMVDLKLSPRDLAAKLTMVGLAVDAVEPHDDDHLLEFDLTSNRPDCLSHLGIAREAAVVSGSALRLPPSKINEVGEAAAKTAAVEILNPDLCPRYTGRLIRGVKIGPSPAWLVKKLEALGQRSVNNVADITNYVMLELGQPLHAFDLNRLRGRRIVVRTARPGEIIITLDGEERELKPEMLVIADAERPVALAGIKGGEDSGITSETTEVLLEAAYFTPAQVRATSKALGLSTEASYRFERGVDPEIAPVASARAAALIAELAGGEIVGELIDVYPQPKSRPLIGFRRSRCTALTGLEVELGTAERILRELGFHVEAEVAADSLRAGAPSWRIDISLEEDLIEEVSRIVGYEKVKTTLPGGAGAGAYLKGESGRRTARQTLTSLGYNEAISFSFVNPEADCELSRHPVESQLQLKNPIDETQSVMRTTLLGGLLKALGHNFNHGTRTVRLFEMGKCFVDRGPERPAEIERLALVATGARHESDWLQAAARIDFYDLKGAVEAIGANLGLPELEFTPIEEIGYLHPGRAAIISMGKKPVGQMGQLHPRVATNYKFRQPVLVAELEFGELLAADRLEVRYQALPKYPTVVRDLALLIDQSVPWAAIENAIIELAIPELVAVRLFDLYAGRELPPGKHSMALSLRYRAADRTLTDEEINTAHNRIVKRLTDKFGAEPR
ncbi:MAG TPA: phenylalanine--tRNA ligase subunit beta [Blastocatellia bacterium]|nr:phenylalanine--tRNA ligase subunit beta [Blastocatellia bacterium]